MHSTVMDLYLLSWSFYAVDYPFGTYREKEDLEVSGKFSVLGWKDKIYGGNTSLFVFGKGG